MTSVPASANPPRILIGDDDRDLCALLDNYLSLEGFQIELVHSADAVLQRLEQGEPPLDLLILDVMMPGRDGLSALRELRQRHSLPVLMLSARGEPVDRVVGLELGADDYLSKPCLPRELLARVKALLRRAPAAEQARSDRLTLGALTLDLGQRYALLGSEPLRLTGAEFGVLRALMRTPGQPVDKAELTREGLGREIERFDRSIDVHVSRLRHKLGEAGDGAPRIDAVRGVGYVIVDRPS